MFTRDVRVSAVKVRKLSSPARRILQFCSWVWLMSLVEGPFYEEAERRRVDCQKSRIYKIVYPRIYAGHNEPEVVFRTRLLIIGEGC